MSDFDKWVDENYPNVEPIDAWNHQQKKIDAVKKLCDAYWLDDDRDYNIYIQEIEELLK